MTKRAGHLGVSDQMLRYDLNPKSEFDYTSLTSALCLTINTAPMSK